MVSYPRLILQFAAITGVATMLSTAVPAVAAEGTVPARETAAAPVKAAPPVARRASQGIRTAASHYRHHQRLVSAVRSDLGCSGVWCGRHFVLMIGVGY
jgi:hypothetical protein